MQDDAANMGYLGKKENSRDKRNGWRKVSSKDSVSRNDRQGRNAEAAELWKYISSPGRILAGASPALASGAAKGAMAGSGQM